MEYPIRYCKTHNLSYHRFSYWRSQLLKTENKMVVGAAKSAGTSFVKVVPCKEPGTDNGLIMTLPNGITFQGIHSGHIDLIGDLLRRL